MEWLDILRSLGPGGVVIAGLLAYAFTLGVYKLIKDWLPF